jgi:hypothetical protein
MLLTGQTYRHHPMVEMHVTGQTYRHHPMVEMYVPDKSPMMLLTGMVLHVVTKINLPTTTTTSLLQPTPN